MGIKLAIVGGRDFNDYGRLRKVFESLKLDVSELVSGGAKGTDTLAEILSQDKKIPITIFPADWERNGKKAGMLRNKQIVDYCDEVLAFWDEQSRGTANTISLTTQSKKKLYLEIY